MAQKPETKYIGRVHSKLDAAVYREKMNNAFRGGTPDVYYEGNKDTLFVEYKWYPTVPEIVDLSDYTRKPSLTKLQQKWLERRYNNGHRAAVIAGMPEGGLILEGIDFKYRIDLRALNLLSSEGVAAWIYEETMKK